MAPSKEHVLEKLHKLQFIAIITNIYIFLPPRQWGMSHLKLTSLQLDEQQSALQEQLDIEMKIVPIVEMRQLKNRPDSLLLLEALE